MRESYDSIISKIPVLRRLYFGFQQILALKKNSYFPPGHYYSPIASLDSIRKREKEIWKNVGIDGIEGIDLNTENQVALVNELSVYYKDIPFKTEKQVNIRYYFENTFYSYTDAIILYSMIRHLKPKRIIEIGSGYSSAVMLDVSELFFQSKINLSFIEPNPARLFCLITGKDKQNSTIIEKEIQCIDSGFFKSLEEKDILFVDSSHVSKTGSDLNYIVFEVLPLLKKGVYIHFHDIFYPFEYPKEWVFEGRNWNEDYILKAFLMYNNRFKISLFADYLHKHRKDAFSKMPLCYKNCGGNIWLVKN